MDAAGYFRISREMGRTDAAGMFEAAEDNRRQLRDYCAREGLNLVGIWSDIDISGGVAPLDREGFQSLWEARSRFQMVVVPDVDRYSRDTLQALKADVVLAAAGIELCYIDMTGIDLSTPEGEMMLTFRRGIGQFYRKSTGRTWSRVLSNRRSAGLPRAGNTAPYGFRYIRPEGTRGTYEVIPEQAEIVTEIFDRYRSGHSLRSIAINLNQRGIPTLRGATWRTRTLADILGQTAYIGMIDDKQAVWEGFIDGDTFQAVQSLRASQRSEYGLGHPGKYLLTAGVGFCGACGAGLNAQAGGPKRTALYVCPTQQRGDGCKGGATSLERADRLVFDHLWWTIHSDWIASALEAEFPPTPTPDRDIARLGRRLDGLLTRLIDPDLPEVGYERMKAKIRELEQQRDILSETRSRLESVSVADREASERIVRLRLADLRGGWESAPVEERRDILRAVYERIETVPETRPKELTFTLRPQWEEAHRRGIERKREQAAKLERFDLPTGVLEGVLLAAEEDRLLKRLL